MTHRAPWRFLALALASACAPDEVDPTFEPNTTEASGTESSSTAGLSSTSVGTSATTDPGDITSVDPSADTSSGTTTIALDTSTSTGDPLPRLDCRSYWVETDMVYYPDVRALPAPGERVLGGGCALTHAQSSPASPHAEVMVRSEPDGDGWRCMGADPANIPNPAQATALVRSCAVDDGDVELECVRHSSFASGYNPATTVTLSAFHAAEGYAITGGGCTSCYAGGGCAHAAPLVSNHPVLADDGSVLGWSCTAADPPNVPLDASVEAHYIACRVPPPASLVCRGVMGETVVDHYPRSDVDVTTYLGDDDWELTGGGCDVSWASDGSAHAEYVVRDTAVDDRTWGCQGADPPNIPQLDAFARAWAVACRIE